jgi:Holliday junction resolvase
MDELRKRYVAEGFTFISDPLQVPSFFGSYRPDAIATKPGLNIAIEVKQRPDSAASKSLQDIRRLFEGRPDWQFVVMYEPADPYSAIAIPKASAATIRAQLDELKTTGDHGQRRAAFILGWSLLEAALHRLADEKGRRPRAPAAVVEALASLGYVSPSAETRLRHLVNLRNRILHGDLTAQPTPDEMNVLLSAVEEATL